MSHLILLSPVSFVIQNEYIIHSRTEIENRLFNRTPCFDPHYLSIPYRTEGSFGIQFVKPLSAFWDSPLKRDSFDKPYLMGTENKSCLGTRKRSDLIYFAIFFFVFKEIGPLCRLVDDFSRIPHLVGGEERIRREFHRYAAFAVCIFIKSILWVLSDECYLIPCVIIFFVRRNKGAFKICPTKRGFLCNVDLCSTCTERIGAETWIGETGECWHSAHRVIVSRWMAVGV
jgi:hypothetical protein